MKNSTCHCGNTSPEIRHEAHMITFAGNEYPVVEEYYYCKNCSHEWVSPAQLKESLAQVTAIKRRAQGFLAPQDIKALRERHGLTQKQAAIIFGGGDNAFSKYERGEIYPSAAMDKLMCLFDTIPEVKKRLIQQSDLSDIEKAILLPTDGVIKTTAVVVVAFHHHQPAIAGVR